MFALRVATCGLLVIALTGTAAAQNAAAEALFRDGDRLLAAGDIPAACAAFASSNRIEPRAGTLIRLGHCREQNGQLASAWSAYSDALGRVKDLRKQRIARAQLELLEPRLSQLAIALPAGHQVAGLVITRNGVVLDPGLWNRSVPVDGGSYVIEARAPGHHPWTTTVEVATEQARVTVDVPRLEIDPEAAPRARGSTRPSGAPKPEGGDRTLGTRRGIAIGLGVGSVAAAAGGIAFGLSARGLAGDAHDLCPDVMCADHAAANAMLERSRRRVLYANVAYGTAGVFAVAAAVLWFTGGDDRDAGRGVSVMPALAPDHAGAVVTGRF